MPQRRRDRKDDGENKPIKKVLILGYFFESFFEDRPDDRRSRLWTGHRW
jgi:hypothetical protein